MSHRYDFMTRNLPPVIALDGLSGSGKGEAAGRVAKELNFNRLDSGLYYRAVALRVRQTMTDPANEDAVAILARQMKFRVVDGQAFMGRRDVSVILRTDEISALTAKVGAHGRVRHELLPHFRRARTWFGLVSDGRDGHEVFPDSYKFFFIANDQVRARRRVAQLLSLGQEANMREVLKGIRERDEADRTRSVSPLVQHPEAIVVDTTRRTPKQVVQFVVDNYKRMKKEREL